MARTVWSLSAARDLEDIAAWLSEHHSSEHAQSFIDKVESSVLHLSHHPDSGRLVPELLRHNIAIYREIVLTPWRLFYSKSDDTLVIHAVIDGRRNIEDILLRRNIRDLSAVHE